MLRWRASSLPLQDRVDLTVRGTSEVDCTAPNGLDDCPLIWDQSIAYPLIPETMGRLRHSIHGSSLPRRLQEQVGR